MFEELEGKGLLIHHWDTDGICSARLLLEYLSDKIDSMIPQIGNYFLTKEEINNCFEYNFIIIVDMAFPKKNILKLARKPVIIFNHHLQEEIKEVEHHNPIIKGEDPFKYPSASWIINEYLSNSVNLFALLGVVGDHEKEIKNNKFFYEMISNFCRKNELEFNDLLQMVYLLDSNYKLCDKKGVEEAPYILLNYDNPDDILNNDRWNKNLEILKEEIAVQLKKPDKIIKGTILKKIDTPYNIISTITRKLKWESGKNIMVINTGFFDDRDQVYVRSNKNLEFIIKRAKFLGFNAGGKKKVLGAVVPKERTNSFVKEIIDFLGRK